MIAEKYDMENGQALFMSRKTKSKLQDDIFANCCTAPTLASLEYPMNSEVFVSTCNHFMALACGCILIRHSSSLDCHI
jgi:hypothetical protein